MAQVLDPPELMLLGIQDIPVKMVGATKIKLAVCDEPFRVPVMTAFWVVVRMPAVAVTMAVMAPGAIVTEAGRVRKGLLDESETVAPPKGAG